VTSIRPSAGVQDGQPAPPKPDGADLLQDLSPAGHLICLRLLFAAPLLEINALPPLWVEQYTRQGLMVADPVIRWIHANEGVTRWSRIALEDPRGVLAAAGAQGLRFGAAVSHLDPGPGRPRSFGLFARSDREFTDEELATLLTFLRAQHDALAPPLNLTTGEVATLRLLKSGERLKQIAHRLGVTEGALKQRLRSARTKLDARTAAEAISRASHFGLI
jgi:LuxR family transcriptional regulator